jgi:hypothetical protein
MPWKPGQSGNPLGRPLGSRQKFSAGFLHDLAEVWDQKGRAAIEHTATKNPDLFFSTCARLLPNDVRVSVTQHNPGSLSNDDWQLMAHVLDAVKVLVPDAKDRGSK